MVNPVEERGLNRKLSSSDRGVAVNHIDDVVNRAVIDREVPKKPEIQANDLLNSINVVLDALRGSVRDLIIKSESEIRALLDQKLESSQRIRSESRRKKLVARAREQFSKRMKMSGVWEFIQNQEELLQIAVLEPPDPAAVSASIEFIRMQIEDLRRLLPKLTPEQSKSYTDVIENIYKELSEFSYFTQQRNLNILYKGPLPAWERTCNVTSLATVLVTLGVGTYHYSGDLYLLQTLYERFSQYLRKKPKDKNPDVRALRLPDFLQIVLISIELDKILTKKYTQGIRPSKELKKESKLARNNAARVATNSPWIFREISEKFGVKVISLSPVNGGILNIPTVGRKRRNVTEKNDSELKIIIAYLLQYIWSATDYKVILELSNLLQQFGITSLNWNYTQGKQKLLFGERLKQGRISSHADWRELILSTLVVVVENEANMLEKNKAKEKKYTPVHIHVSSDNLWEYAKSCGLLNKVAKQSSELLLIWLKVAQSFDTHFPPEGPSPYSDILMRLSGSTEILPYIKKIELIWGISKKLWDAYHRSDNWKEVRDRARSLIDAVQKNGGSMLVLRLGHYLAVKSHSETELLLSDPASGIGTGSTGRFSRVKWPDVNKYGFFRAIHIAALPKNIDSVTNAVAKVLIKPLSSQGT